MKWVSFLLISGTLDNLRMKVAVKRMTIKGVPPTIERWYSRYFKDRVIKTQARRDRDRYPVTCSTPQE